MAQLRSLFGMPLGQDDQFQPAVEPERVEAGTAPPPPTQNFGAGQPGSPIQPTSGGSAAPNQPVDTSGWDVDGFGIPGYTAAAGSFGSAPSGWDPTKWNDPTHQTPKYVWGRIYQEAQQSGDPNWMQTATDRFMQAYPGSRMISGDKILTPWGEEVDIFRDFGGENGISWNVMGGGGGGSNLFGNLASSPSFAGIAAARPGGGGQAGNEFADPNFQAIIEQLGPLHPQYAEYQAWKQGQGAAGVTGTASGGTATGPAAPQGGMQALYDTIGKMLDMSGDYNSGILNRRVESAREDMNRARSSQSDLMKAQLAERGLLGSGAEITGISGLEEQLGDRYSGTVRDIYADESARSDDRLLKTMSIAAGLSEQDADRIVDWFNAQTSRSVGEGQVAATNRRTDADLQAELSDQALRRDLGFADLGLRGELGRGQLGLGRDEAANAYNLGLGRLGYDYDRLGYEDSWMNNSNLINLIETLFPRDTRS